jgi:hypothetical protein
VIKMREEKYNYIPSEVLLDPSLKRKLLNPENVETIGNPKLLKQVGGRSELFDEFTLFFDVFVSDEGLSVFAIGPRNQDLKSFECLVLAPQPLRIAGFVKSKGVDRALLVKFLLPKSLHGKDSLKVKIFYKKGRKTFETPVLNPVKHREGARRFRLAVCTMLQNESRRLANWIEYYLGLGVEHFYIYDNKSIDTEDLYNVLDMYIRKGIVTLLYWPYAYGLGFSTADRCAQTGAYCHCLNWYSEADWVVFCDVDEYFFPLKENSLLPFVDEAEKEGFNQVHAKWVFFGLKGLNEGNLGHFLGAIGAKRLEYDFKKTLGVTSMNFRHAELDSTKPYSQGAIKSIVDAREIFYMGEHYANNSDNKKRKFFSLDELRVNHYNLRHFHTRILEGCARPFFDDSIKRFCGRRLFLSRFFNGLVSNAKGLRFWK